MSLRKVNVTVPTPGCEIVGFLYESDDPSDLGQDMIEVRVPTGVHINAGWYPEGDPSGRYKVQIHAPSFEMPPIYFENVDEVVSMIREWVSLFTDQMPEPIAESDSIETTEDPTEWDSYAEAS